MNPSLNSGVSDDVLKYSADFADAGDARAKRGETAIAGRSSAMRSVMKTCGAAFVPSRLSRPVEISRMRAP